MNKSRKFEGVLINSAKVSGDQKKFYEKTHVGRHGISESAETIFKMSHNACT